ncbi:MAG TPA: hypothetical protein EYG91_02020 [Aquifex aeolicus]|nr:hypothetical protein [Aquifex aeolicus]
MKKLPKIFKNRFIHLPISMPDPIEIVEELLYAVREKEKTERTRIEVERDIKELEFKEKVIDFIFEHVINKKLESKSKVVDGILKVIESQAKKGEIQSDLLRTLVSVLNTPTITNGEIKFLNSVLSCLIIRGVRIYNRKKGVVLRQRKTIKKLQGREPSCKEQI